MLAWLRRRKKGNTAAILLFAVMMLTISFGTFSVAMALYSQGEQSSKIYADIQSYRAATEIACYQYINDLQSVVVEKLLYGDYDFSNPIASAAYDEAIATIQNTVGMDPDPATGASRSLIWKISDIVVAVQGATISDPSLMASLVAKLNEGRNIFVLQLPQYPQIDWTNPIGYISTDEAYLKLLPLEVNVQLTVKGEVLNETLFVDGLYLDVIRESLLHLGTNDTKLTMSIIQNADGSGVQIYREPAV